MSFQGINFSSQHIVPSDDGRLYEAIFEDGALHGCELSYVGAALTIGAGYLMIGGREIEITEDEVFNINEATSGYAQLVLTIDLTQTATIGAFNQVSIDVRYASTEAGFASLIQNDINGAGTKYQQQLALVSLGTGGITGIVAGMPSASLKGAGRVFSIIAVTYPAGLTCTCSDGTTTLTARDTSGKALFNVPNIGTWTVTARKEDGSSTENKTVDITEAGQVETVSISYGLWLFRDGNQYTDATGGWEDGTGYIHESYTKTPVTYDTSINLNSQTNTDAIAKTVNKIDLTDIASIKFTLTESDSSHNNKKLLAIMSNDSGRIATDNIAFIDCGSASVGSVISLDVSGITGKHYVLFSTTNERTFSVNDVRCYREGES